MSNVWAFPPEVNRQADFIKHIVIENIRLRDENARLKERIDQLEKNVTAFAGQLESWGFDAAAKQIRSEIGVDVEAPNFYKLQAENARLKEENERLYLLYQEAVEIIESAMDERCSWCMGKDGKHEPDCEANNWLVSSPNKTQEVER